MDLLLSFIARELETIARRIKNDECEMSETEKDFIVELIGRTNGEKVTKEEACKRLGVSRATFDRMVMDGKLPKGKKKTGDKKLYWNSHDLRKNGKSE